MKKIFAALFTVCLVATSVFAQDAQKEMKKAGKLLGTYNMNPVGNKEKLTEAKNLIDGAMSSGSLDASAEAHVTKARIYNEIAAQEFVAVSINPEAPISDASLQSLSAYQTALELAEKSRAQKNALKGMAELSSTMNNLGFALYKGNDFMSAYKHFNGVLQVNDALNSNEMKPILKDEKSVNDQMYIAGVAAMGAGETEGVKKYFNTLLNKEGYELKSVIFTGLYQAYLKEDEAKAIGFLEKGREMFPDESALLFEEINYYLGKGELNSLIDKLKAAAELEPGNASIRTTLGNVYDQQYQTALEEGNEEEEKRLFSAAFESYNKALEIDPSDFSSMYSLGALYYNKAASVSKKVNVLAEDYSKEGTAKYESAKAEMNELFGKALPYFVKAEGLNANDRNTLIALKEIYARQNDFEKSNEYKAKIEAITE